MRASIFVPTTLLAATLLWLAALLAAPFVVTDASSRDAVVRVAATAYLAGSFVCHQQAGRSFHLSGTQLPVCGRCVGLYAGAAISSAMAFGLAWFRPARDKRPAIGWRAALLGAAVPTVVTLGLEWSHVTPLSNLARAIAGVPLGAVVAWLVAAELDRPDAVD
ncbi:MAG: DUF2085 domain-containing protein [Acidobacteria bacterium]|nr:DUF2085 domain-containing protein [Acidobacteriota bacterium]